MAAGRGIMVTLAEASAGFFKAVAAFCSCGLHFGRHVFGFATGGFLVFGCVAVGNGVFFVVVSGTVALFAVCQRGGRWGGMLDEDKEKVCKNKSKSKFNKGHMHKMTEQKMF